MVRGIFVPCDDELPIEIREFPGLESYQQAVGGYIEALDITRPPATIYINENGKIELLDLNRRATAILWTHASRYRGHDVIAGDVVIIGQPDDEGDTQSVPDELVTLLFETPTYKVEVTTISDMETWNGNQARYDNWFKAYIAGLSLAERWALVDNVRVIAA